MNRDDNFYVGQRVKWNDPDLLVKLHAPTLLALAQKELPDSPDFEAEWKRYTASRKDDMRSNAVTMNVKEVARHFAEWQKKQMMKEAVVEMNEELENVIENYFDGWSTDEEDGCAVMPNYLAVGIEDCKDIARFFAEWGMNYTDDFRWPQTLLDAAEAVMNDVIKYRKEHG